MEIIKNQKPDTKHHLTKYPFSDMELNDGLKVFKNPEDTKEDIKKRAASISMSAKAFSKRKNLNWKFSLRTYLDYIIITRIQ